MTTSTKLENQVRDILDKLDRPVPQVLIKCLVAEVTHTNNDDIGFQFGAINLTGSNGEGITAGLLGGLLGALQIDVRGADPGAFFDKSLDGGGADARRAAEHDNAAIFQSVSHGRPPSKRLSALVPML